MAIKYKGNKRRNTLSDKRCQMYGDKRCNKSDKRCNTSSDKRCKMYGE